MLHGSSALNPRSHSMLWLNQYRRRSLTAAFMLAALAAQADTPSAQDAALALIERCLPGRSAEFEIDIIPAAEEGRDVYEVSGNRGRVILRGNTPVSVASALRRYLADGGWGHVSRCGSRIGLPRPLPPPKTSVRVVSPFSLRFAYNFCTLSYTFAWSDIEDWERELDQLALHGYNAALVLAGVEQAWVDTLMQFGYTEAEAREWLVWPSHQAWQQMSNLERFGGTLPPSILRRRLETGQFIVRRMRELGIEPVLAGYYGIVPTDFGQRHPEAAVLGQGGWAGGFDVCAGRRRVSCGPTAALRSGAVLGGRPVPRGGLLARRGYTRRGPRDPTCVSEVESGLDLDDPILGRQSPATARGAARSRPRPGH